MRILHTADWHLGKKLHEVDFYEDQKFFLDWLLTAIEQHQVEALLVSGDIFDQANPSKQAEKLYYHFLKAVADTCCRQVVITGGNHDSVQTLEAAANLLESFNVSVVAGMPDQPEDEVVILKNKSDKEDVVVCATPYLRDRDIYRSLSGQTYKERVTEVKKGILTHYADMADLIQKQHSELPVIAMGHLFVHGVSNDSEAVRDVQVGNLAGIDISELPKTFDYIALGHIHRKQKLNGHPNAWYCGSPLPLSFSERDYQHSVLLLDVDTGKKIEVTELEVPLYRKLITLTCTIEQIESSIKEIDIAENERALVELKIKAPQSYIDQHHQIEAIMAAARYITVVKYRIELENGSAKNNDVNAPDLDTFTPSYVFESILNEKNYGIEECQQLLEAFHTLVEATHEQGGDL